MGNFLEIAQSDDDGYPLTIIKLAKNHWQHVQKLNRNEKLRYVLESKITLASPGNVSSALTKKKPQPEHVSDECNVKMADDEFLLQYLPESVAMELDDEAITIIREAGLALVETECLQNSTKENDTSPSGFNPVENDYEAALVALIASSPSSVDKWSSCTLRDFMSCLSNAEYICKSFTVAELVTILKVTPGQMKVSGLL